MDTLGTAHGLRADAWWFGSDYRPGQRVFQTGRVLILPIDRNVRTHPTGKDVTVLILCHIVPYAVGSASGWPNETNWIPTARKPTRSDLDILLVVGDPMVEAVD